MKYVYLLVLSLFLTVASYSQPLTVNLSSITDSVECDCPIGMADIHSVVTGGTPPYSYLWSNGAITPAINFLLPGVYTLTVTDAVMATATDNFTITSTTGFTEEIYYQAPTQGACDGFMYFFTGYCPSGSFSLNTPNYPITMTNGGGDLIHIANICQTGGIFYHEVYTTISNCPGSYNWTSVDPSVYYTGPFDLTYTPPSTFGACTSNTRFKIYNYHPVPWQFNWGISGNDGIFAPNAKLFDMQGNQLGISWGVTTGSAFQHEDSTIIDFGLNLTGTFAFECIGGIINGDTLGIVIRDTFSLFANDCGEFSGRIYYDINGNCVFNPGTDLVMPDTYLNFQPGNFSVITNDSGEFIADLPFNTYTVTQNNPYGFTQNCPAAPINITLDAVTPAITMDIGNNAGNPHCDNDVLLIGTTSRPGFTTLLNIRVENNNILISDPSTLTLNFDPLLQFISADDAGVNNGTTVTWNVPAINGFSDFFTSVELQVPAGVSIGTILNHNAFITASVCDTILANDTAFYQRDVTGPLDPNDKTSSPPGAGPLNLIPVDQKLTYTIRFENTGNDFAQNVILVDSLSPSLDLSTLKMELASHNCYFELEAPGTLIVTFPNIMLPDSSVDPVGSKGYFVYSIEPLPGLSEGTVIENKAGIYFDYNAPVITNTVSQTLSNGPVALCQNTQLYLDSAGNAMLSAELIDAGSAAFFGISAITISDSLFTCQDLGSQQVVLHATSVNNETDSCLATVTVSDSLAPVAMTINSNIYLDASGQATLDALMLDGGTTDNCGTFTSSVIPLIVDCSNLGIISATVTFTDVSLNMSTALSQLTILDTIAPLSVCHDTILFVDSTCFVSVTAQELDNGSTDNCGITQMNLSQSTFTCSNVGLNTVVFSVTDASGNISQCNSNITVIDVTGIKEAGNNFLEIHPNPSNGLITLPAFVTGGDLVITDLKGKVVYKESSLKNNELLLNEISQGTYIFVVSKNGIAFRNIWVKQ